MRWVLFAALLTLVNGDALEFGWTLAMSLTRSFSDKPQVQQLPVPTRNTYVGAANQPAAQGGVLQTCLAATATDCQTQDARVSPLIRTMPHAVTDAQGYITTAYVYLEPAFGLPATGVSASYSIDLRLRDSGGDVAARRLSPAPVIVDMPFKDGDCPRDHVAIGLGGACGVACMMYDSRLATWTKIGITTASPVNMRVNCTLSTLPANILVSQFLNAIRLAMTVDKPVSVVQAQFNTSLWRTLAFWTGTTTANFRQEGLRAVGTTRTKVYFTVMSTNNALDPETVFQTLKQRVPSGAQVVSDRSGQGALTVLLVEKYYTEVPSPTAAPEGMCNQQSDCPLGTYCDEFSNCFSCGPGSVSPGFCDSITYDCCSTAFRQQCPSNPYGCSDTAPTPVASVASAPDVTPIMPGVALPFSTPSPSPGPGYPAVASPSAPVSAVASPSSPPSPAMSAAPSAAPTTAPAVLSLVRTRGNGTLFRMIVSPQVLNESLAQDIETTLHSITNSPVRVVSLNLTNSSMVLVGELGSEPAVSAYDAVVSASLDPGSRLRTSLGAVSSIQMLCAYGLWRPRCTTNTLEGSLNATLAIRASADAAVSVLETTSGIQNRFVVTELHADYVVFSIVPPEKGEPSSETVFEDLRSGLANNKTAVVQMQFSALQPGSLPHVQAALCSYAGNALELSQPEKRCTLTSFPNGSVVFTISGAFPSSGLTSAGILSDSQTFEALKTANNGTALAPTDIHVYVQDSPSSQHLARYCGTGPGCVVHESPRPSQFWLAVGLGVGLGLLCCLLLCVLLWCMRDRLFGKYNKRKQESPQHTAPPADVVPLKQPPPEISYKSSFSHKPISLNEHEGSSRTVEYDTHGAPEDSSPNRNFHFSYPPRDRTMPPPITPMRVMNSPDSASGCEGVLLNSTPLPRFVPSPRTPLTLARREPPKPPSSVPPHEPPRVLTPSVPQSRQEHIRPAEAREVKETPVSTTSSRLFSAPPSDSDEYSDENTNRCGESRDGEDRANHVD